VLNSAPKGQTAESAQYKTIQIQGQKEKGFNNYCMLNVNISS
jgi:hypothetical protein